MHMRGFFLSLHKFDAIPEKPTEILPRVLICFAYASIEAR
jgi:hypothetical protein